MDAKIGEGPRAARRSIWLLATVLFLAALVGFSLLAHKTPTRYSWRRSLAAFRDDEPEGVPQSPKVNAVLILRNHVRQALWQRQPYLLSQAESRLLIDSLKGPADELLQSEALDVLNLAERANALSAPQASEAVETALAVLTEMPQPMVRLEGARFLAHSGDARRVPALRRLLHDPEPKIRNTARQALAGLDREPLPQP